ncbi:Os02g0672250 [Oryza sativa Japonica Group]|uniref:Os02g0672250 protein n=1 Tax=Oryza sativa subsp. japonica TaxID=39947 RepID=A0A0P0VMQ6_ORYSJ|nr:hypothetical protein EE612_012947 [Oryza sativa]BAS80243.1 Os02g0672250 [Oryza sativa Japonica Group]
MPRDGHNMQEELQKSNPLKLRVAQVVCQSLQTISSELVLIPQNMIMCRATSDLNARMATQVEIKLSRMAYL